MRVRTIAVWLMAVALLVTGTVAGAANNAGGSPNSEAALSITFSEDCRTVTVTSTKDISYVRAHFSEFEGDPEDNRTRGQWDYINEDSGDLNPSPFVVTFDEPVVIAQAKSGTTVVTEECEPEDKPQCDDGIDNDGGGKVDLEDPGCDGPEDDDETSECQDTVDNADEEDILADADDPGCHTDGDPGDGDDTYDPEDDDETDECLSQDTDGDGVDDCDDLCPDTESGATVDADGCEVPTCERGNDADGDGVDDCDDLCPDTESGATVDADGCPIVDPGPTLTCRANLIAAALGGNALPNLFEANAPSNPCGSEQTGLLVTLSPLLGDGGLGLLDADNRIVLADPSGSVPGTITIDAAWADTASGDGTADADSGVLFLAINDGTDDQIVVEAVTSRSATTQSGDACTQETEAHVVKVTIAGNEIPITGAHTPLITPELYDVIELHLEDAGDGANEGPDDTGAQAVDASALMDNVLAGLADSETGCA